MLFYAAKWRIHDNVCNIRHLLTLHRQEVGRNHVALIIQAIPQGVVYLAGLYISGAVFLAEPHDISGTCRRFKYYSIRQALALGHHVEDLAGRSIKITVKYILIIYHFIFCL